MYGGIVKEVLDNGTFWDSNKGDSYVGRRRYVKFDASSANKLYGASSTVTPLSLATNYFIKY